MLSFLVILCGLGFSYGGGGGWVCNKGHHNNFYNVLEKQSSPVFCIHYTLHFLHYIIFRDIFHVFCLSYTCIYLPGVLKSQKEFKNLQASREDILVHAAMKMGVDGWVGNN